MTCRAHQRAPIPKSEQYIFFTNNQKQPKVMSAILEAIEQLKQLKAEIIEDLSRCTFPELRREHMETLKDVEQVISVLEECGTVDAAVMDICNQVSIRTKERLS